MVPEAPLDSTEHGLAATGEGWFVLNAREARWQYTDGRSALCIFEGDVEFRQVGIALSVLLRHEAGVEQETTDPSQAYARIPQRVRTRFREEWLPDR